MTRPAPPARSRDLLALALQAYEDHCRRIGCAVSDGPDLSPAAAYAGGRAALEARLAAESYALSRASVRTLMAAIDTLREARALEEEVEWLELFPRRFLGLLERRREPHLQRPGGRRWLDGRIPGGPRQIGAAAVRVGLG